MDVERTELDEFVVTLTDDEQQEIRKMATKDNTNVEKFIKNALESGVRLYRFIILGKE